MKSRRKDIVHWPPIEREGKKKRKKKRRPPGRGRGGRSKERERRRGRERSGFGSVESLARTDFMPRPLSARPASLACILAARRALLCFPLWTCLLLSSCASGCVEAIILCGIAWCTRRAKRMTQVTKSFAKQAFRNHDYHAQLFDQIQGLLNAVSTF